MPHQADLLTVFDPRRVHELPQRKAKTLSQNRKIIPFNKAQTHQQRFGGLLAAVQHARFGDAVLSLAYRAQEILGLLVPNCRHSSAPPVGTGPDSAIILIAPIGEVVAAL